MLANYYQTTYSAIRAILPDVWIIIMARISCRVVMACDLHPQTCLLGHVHAHGASATETASSSAVACTDEGDAFALMLRDFGLQGRTWEMDSGANWQKFMTGPGYTRVVQDLHKCA